MQDDDVDSDNDILYSAHDNCMKDLRKALRLAQDTSCKHSYKINKGVANNCMIRDRVSNPHMYDRNGILKPLKPKKESNPEAQ